MYGDKPVDRQPPTRGFLLARDLLNGQAKETTEHFPYQRNTSNMWLYIILLERRVSQGSRIKGRTTGHNTPEM
ncbi:hypothetical protein TNCV_3120421 [Trichonephila clavipes]|uniref:Uncharacterized protein n=1 Tax=Trichonephila clavipes TaxID=2585209 RepID=A0A8X6WAA4_TRICX|nr:hypothetical protein TNCV_3120421 [Trichonephila clavipes]